MRVLFFLLAPLLGYSQLDTTLTYSQKEVHNITIKPDSSTWIWKIDTISFEIKFNKAAKTIKIGGYGTYKIRKHEIHGATDGPPTDRPGYHYYELANGTKLTWIEKWVYWEWPVKNRKTKMIVFVVN